MESPSILTASSALTSNSVLTAGVDRLLADSGTGQAPRQILDLGGGTGGQAVRLAEAGHQVTVVDPSLDALAALARRASEREIGERLRAVQGDAEDLADVVEAGSIDLVLCHGVLEVVDNPLPALVSIRQVLRATGRLSLLVVQREAGVLLRVASGQVRAASAILHHDDGRWGPGDPLQRRFSRSTVFELLAEAGFDVLGDEGIRIFADLVPVSAEVADPSTAAILARMEQIASTVPALRDIAIQLHVHARPA